MNRQLQLPRSSLDALCRKWKISQLHLFGSALGSEFGPDSDVDFLAAFLPEATWSLLDHVQMEMEFEQLVGRRVDIVSRRGLERSRNGLRRKAILESAELIYAA